MEWPLGQRGRRGDRWRYGEHRGVLCEEKTTDGKALLVVDGSRVGWGASLGVGDRVVIGCRSYCGHRLFIFCSVFGRKNVVSLSKTTVCTTADSVTDERGHRGLGAKTQHRNNRHNNALKQNTAKPNRRERALNHNTARAARAERRTANAHPPTQEGTEGGQGIGMTGEGRGFTGRVRRGLGCKSPQ